MLQHQLWQSVDSFHGSQPLVVPAFSLQVTEEWRYEGVIKDVPSVSDDGRLRLRLLMLMVLLVVMIELLQV